MLCNATFCRRTDYAIRNAYLIQFAISKQLFLHTLRQIQAERLDNVAIKIFATKQISLVCSPDSGKLFMPHLLKTNTKIFPFERKWQKSYASPGLFFSLFLRRRTFEDRDGFSAECGGA
jgi:hypothetical protein